MGESESSSSSVAPDQNIVKEQEMTTYTVSQHDLLLDMVDEGINIQVKGIERNYTNEELHLQSWITGKWGKWRDQHNEQTNDKNMKYLAVDDSYYTLTFISMINELNEQLKRDDSHTYFFKCVMLAFIQIIIVILVIYQIFVTGLEFNKAQQNAEPTVILMGLRLIVSYLFHIGISNKVKNAYIQLKFLKNNWNRFKLSNQLAALLICAFQIYSMILLEIMSFIFITTWNNVAETVMNYIVFFGVSEIDTLYTKSQKDLEIQELLEDLQNKKFLIIKKVKFHKMPEKEKIECLRKIQENQKNPPYDVMTKEQREVFIQNEKAEGKYPNYDEMAKEGYLDSVKFYIDSKRKENSYEYLTKEEKMNFDKKFYQEEIREAKQYQKEKWEKKQEGKNSCMKFLIYIYENFMLFKWLTIFTYYFWKFFFKCLYFYFLPYAVVPYTYLTYNPNLSKPKE